MGGAHWRYLANRFNGDTALCQVTLTIVYYCQHVTYMCLFVGDLQASPITHCDSLLISEISDEILRQIGVRYDPE